MEIHDATDVAGLEPDGTRSGGGRAQPRGRGQPRGPGQPRGRALPWLLGITAGAVLLQATLAGLFLSGVGEARLAHTIVGWLLPYFALAPAIVAVVANRNRRIGPGMTAAVAALPVLLYAQEVLGHLPFPVSTAVHVPLGTVLLTYAALLAAVTARDTAWR